MKFYIPELGDSIRLIADWTFDLEFESRNTGIWDAFDEKYNLEDYRKAEQKRINDEWLSIQEEYFKKNPSAIAWWHNHRWKSVKHSITLPADTIMKIDRIYIRKGAEDYSSVTFVITSSPCKKLTPIKEGGTFPKGQKRRFWAKLEAVNTIEYEKV